MRLTPPIARDSIVRITQRFNPPSHFGIDYSCVEGTPIYAAADGVAYRGNQPSGFGLYIRLECPGSVYIYAAHLRAWAVADGARVVAGDVIGYSGNTGNSTGPHLHFEVRIGSRYQSAAVDPEPMIEWPGETRTVLTTLHVQRHLPYQNAFARDVGAEWIKIVNPPEDTTLFPDVPRVLVRIWTDPTDAGYISAGAPGGAQYVHDMLPRWGRVPDGHAFELWNEPDCNSNVGLANLNNATLGAIAEANRHGIHLCILNLAEGNPHDNGQHDETVVVWKWRQLLPCIRAAIEGGHYLGRHCYWRPGVEGPTGRYHALGRLKSDIDTLAALGIDTSRLKVLVNEISIDGGIEGHTETKEQGWRDLSDEATYRAQMIEAERYARGIPQIRALMYFTAGWEAPWDGFEHDESFCRTLVAPLKAIGGAISEIPPQPTTPTPSEPLPNDEQGSVAVLVTKARWWAEEEERVRAEGDDVRADNIHSSLIALLYRIEDALAA